MSLSLISAKQIEDHQTVQRMVELLINAGGRRDAA
jgi:hypothetical protein